MKNLIAMACLAAALPALAQDAAGPMAGAFGNTIVSTTPKGVVTKTYIDADGSYRSVADGAESRGQWTMKKGLICYTRQIPAPAAPLCTLGPGKKVGGKWAIFQDDGTSTKVTIVAGR